MGRLHDADRGGFIFAPEVGLHENVHELDFARFYPNIICTWRRSWQNTLTGRKLQYQRS